MKLIRSLSLAGVALAGLLVGGSARADWSHRFTPCTYWRYDFNSSMYGCTGTGMQIEVPDYYEYRQLDQTVQQLERTVQSLEMTVQNLESRIRTLESRP